MPTKKQSRPPVGIRTHGGCIWVLCKRFGAVLQRECGYKTLYIDAAQSYDCPPPQCDTAIPTPTRAAGTCSSLYSPSPSTNHPVSREKEGRTNFSLRQNPRDLPWPVQVHIRDEHTTRHIASPSRSCCGKRVCREGYKKEKDKG
jgi:hypothetical protein